MYFRLSVLFGIFYWAPNIVHKAGEYFCIKIRFLFVRIVSIVLVCYTHNITKINCKYRFNKYNKCNIIYLQYEIRVQ